MAVFKCKMCGGTIEFNQGDTVGVCDSCGTKQTLPNVNDDAISSLYNRANTLRMKSEFDRAEELYNKIIAYDETQAEAYWGIILCKFGIEYVEDPKTFKRVPTCHRTSFDAITADEDFKLAVKYGDAEQKKLYRAEAKAIDAIQKDILNIAKNEKPFDIFICYKETDESGKRTQDSVVANEIYHQLTQEGFKVFYAAITLEDKLGQEYEPYIFAALNSAKVMLVIGSKPEYFTAVWVKNEWSRFLKLMKKDRSKLLIPCYKDMDAYELPDDFAHLQAQDMSKIGFINDIVRGIKKVVDNDSSAQKKSVAKETVVMQNENGNVRALLDRGFMALEDGEWDKADGFFEQALNFDAKIAEAYLGKLMVELRVHRKEQLANCEEPFYNSNNYQKAVRFGDDKLIADLEGYIKHINERNENNRLTETYTSAINAMNSAETEVYFKAAARAFQSIADFKDSKEKAKECLEKAESARKDAILEDGKLKMNVDSISNYEDAIKLFESVSGWRDADEQIAVCKQKIEQLKIKEEEDKLEAERKAEERRIENEKNKQQYIKIAKIGGPILAVVIVFIIILNSVIIPSVKYNSAVKMMNNGEYEDAIAAFEELDGYKESENQIKECNYLYATDFLNKKDYTNALIYFNKCGDYKDTNNQVKKTKMAEASYLLDAKKYDEAYAILNELGDTDSINESMYNRAMEYVKADDKVSAYLLLSKIVGYKDADDKAKEYKPLYKNYCLSTAKVGDKVTYGTYEQDNDTSNGKEDIEWLVLEKEGNKLLLISDKGLDSQRYNESRDKVTWEICSLRKWMNNTFLNSAFSTDEQKRIQSTNVSADENPDWDTDPGKATKDKVFLLSINEANKYFASDEEIQCVPTAYAIENGAGTCRYDAKDGAATCHWWLRSPGYNQVCAAYVGSNGLVDEFGYNVDHDSYYNENSFVEDGFCVRPAIWISL